MQNEFLTVIFRTLPDIHTEDDLPAGYADYGRFGITTQGSLFFLPLRSSHPSNTKDGFYWAVDASRSALYISPRGYSGNLREIVNDEMIRWLARQIGLKRKFKAFKIIEESDALA